METVQAIFAQLGVDSSFVPQFVIVLVVFILAQVLFLGKLQFVLESREEKTVKLESSADETIEKINKMQASYKSKMDEANRASLKEVTEKKQKIAEKYTQQFKQSEKEVGTHVDRSRAEFANEVANNKDKYLSESESLANSLVQKILQ